MLYEKKGDMHAITSQGLQTNDKAHLHPEIIVYTSCSLKVSPGASENIICYNILVLLSHFSFFGQIFLLSVAANTALFSCRLKLHVATRIEA